jgi:hypothetical protein
MLARRSVQRLLYGSAAYLNESQRLALAARLNRNNRDTIEAEWELALLASLASVGEVEHEPDLGGRARLDVRFRSPNLRFVADVRAVSDEEYHRVNPIHQLAREFSRLDAKLRSEGIQGGFDFRVNGVRAAPRKGRYKTRLILPPTHDFRRVIFDARFAQFLSAIRQAPGQVHRHAIDTAEASVSIVFNPGGNGMRSYSYPPYNVAHDARRNVVYRALEDKSKQIKRAGPRDSGELAGVIICDGGCGLVHSLVSGGTVSLDGIVNTFLCASGTVDFVCIVDVRKQISLWRSADQLLFNVRVWSTRHTDSVKPLEDVFKRAVQVLPRPIRTAVNTLNHLNWAAGSDRRLYSTYSGSGTMTEDSIEISLRAAMDYLTGRIDRAEFEHVVSPDWLGYLRRCLDNGRGISDVSIFPRSAEDDDGLIIRLKAHDAAAAPFRTTAPKELPDENSEDADV